MFPYGHLNGREHVRRADFTELTPSSWEQCLRRARTEEDGSSKATFLQSGNSALSETLKRMEALPVVLDSPHCVAEHCLKPWRKLWQRVLGARQVLFHTHLSFILSPI